jgi:hypothetical protein
VASFKAEPGITLRFREKLAPSRESSGPPEELRGLECGKDGLDMGEYDRGVDEGENDDTWRSMTNSSVEFVSVTILLRNADETA